MKSEGRDYMYEYAFKRVEEKYFLTPEKKNKLFKKIKSYLEKDKYYESTICNIYFDTSNNDLIINSIDKPIFKEKIRLRSYKIPTIDDDVFLEIKEKYNGTVGKRRIKIKLRDFYDYLENGAYDNKNQVMKEINYYFNYYDLKPSIFIAYDRKSFIGKENKNFRITIDSNLRSRKDNLKLEFGDIGEKYIDNDYYVMEVKTLGSMPLWFVRALSELKIYPISFSKYGMIYEKENAKKGELNYA